MHKQDSGQSPAASACCSLRGSFHSCQRREPGNHFTISLFSFASTLRRYDTVSLTDLGPPRLLNTRYNFSFLPAPPLHPPTSSRFIFFPFFAPLHLLHLERCLVDHSFIAPPFPSTRSFLLVGPVVFQIHPASFQLAIAFFSASPLAQFRCMTIYDFERCPSFPSNLLMNVKRFVDVELQSGTQPPRGPVTS